MTLLKEHKAILLILLISAVALFINVGTYSVIESSDARYAEIARMMYISGDYLNPNLLEIHHFHKPPFTYQITALGYKMFGVNPFGARFFLQIAVLIQIFLVYLIALELFKKKEIAIWSALIYISFPIVLIASRNLTTDAFVALFALLSIYTWIKYRKNGQFGYLYFFALSLALGFLTKGPVVFLVPLIFIIFYNRTEHPKHDYSYHHLAAFLLFLAVSASWYVYLIVQNPHFLDYFIEKQTIDRFSKNAFGRTEPFWYFILLAPLVGMPWLLNFPYLIKKNMTLFSGKTISLALFLGTALPLFFFSVSSSKRILYILPLYGLFAILLAYLMAQSSENTTKTVNKITLGYALVFLLLLAVAPLLPVKLIIPGSLALSALIFIPLVLWLYKTPAIENKMRPFYISLLVSLLLLIGGSLVLNRNPLKSNGTSPLTDFIKAQHMQERNILVYNTRKPSIAFNLDKMIISLNDGSNDLQREVVFETDENWKNYLINMKNKKEIQALKEVMKKPSVLLVYKNDIQPHSQWLLAYYTNKTIMGKWRIYY